MKTKKWYQSLTVWFNILTGLLAVAEVFANEDILSTQAYAIILGVGNVVLRLFKTDSKVEL